MPNIYPFSNIIRISLIDSYIYQQTNPYKYRIIHSFSTVTDIRLIFLSFFVIILKLNFIFIVLVCYRVNFCTGHTFSPLHFSSFFYKLKKSKTINFIIVLLSFLTYNFQLLSTECSILNSLFIISSKRML